MYKIIGSNTYANVMIDNVEESAVKQIYAMCNHPAATNPIVIMPDTHAGKGCVIGFTMECGDKVVPDWIGVDIGCGMIASNYGQLDIDDDFLEGLDNHIGSKIPLGRNVLDAPSTFLKDYFYDVFDKVGVDRNYAVRSIGTLGGGNHFIELGIDDSNNIWSIVHTGSRNFGLKVCNYHQKVANDNEGYLSGELTRDYISDMCVAVEYASLNRIIISEVLSGYIGKPCESIETIHNYIDSSSMIRKGAVSARDGELFILPFNMRDGTLICKGRGNEEWNYSAPHGAGRIMSRGQAKRSIDLKDFQDSMKGVYSTSVTSSQLDEAPMAYKDHNIIREHIKPTADIVLTIKPVYNKKA